MFTIYLIFFLNMLFEVENSKNINNEITFVKIQSLINLFIY